MPTDKSIMAEFNLPRTRWVAKLATDPGGAFLAAVVWMPTEPALATIHRTIAPPRRYFGKLRGVVVTDLLISPRGVQEAIEKYVVIAHDQHRSPGNAD